MKFFITISISMCLLAACSSSKPSNISTKLMTRYKTTTPPKNDANGIVDVIPEILSASQSSVSNSKTVYNFAGEGQKAYIKAVAEKSKTMDEFNDAINKKFFVESNSSDVEDITQKNFHVVFSTSQNEMFGGIPLSLGDRIEKLALKVTLDSPSNYIFSSWNQFSTQYGQYNIGSRSFTGSKEVNINPSIPLVAGSVSLGSYDTKSQLTESDSIKRRFILFNGILQDNYFRLEQSGTPEINLTGNASIDITMDLKAGTSKIPTAFYEFTNLKTTKGYSEPKDVHFNITKIIYSQLQHDVKATLTGTYKLRHIIKGDKTEFEGDDEIQYYNGAITSKPITLIKQLESKPTQWGIVIDNTIHVASFDPILNSSDDLSFSSYDDANIFFNWLIFAKKSIGNNNTIVIDKHEIKGNQLMASPVNINKQLDIGKIKIIIL